MDVRFPAVTGLVRAVPAAAYDDAIATYVDAVRGVESILGVVQIGATAVPGLSDIDLLVIFRNGVTLPRWEDVSLQHCLRNHQHRALAFHDVFALPESVFRRLHAFFHVDTMTIHVDNGLPHMEEYDESTCIREMITLEYAIHRCESLMGIMLKQSVTIRELALFISTLRHSARLASSMGIVDSEEADLIVASIEKMRDRVVNSSALDQKIDFRNWFPRIVRLTWSIVDRLSTRLTAPSHQELPDAWHSHLRTGIVDVRSDIDPTVPWERLIRLQQAARLSRYVKVVPLPASAHRHVAAYAERTNAIGSNYGRCYKNLGVYSDDDERRREGRMLRGAVVHEHWKFLSRSGYVRSSGKAYIGLSAPPAARSHRSFAYGLLRTVQLARCRRLIAGFS